VLGSRLVPRRFAASFPAIGPGRTPSPREQWMKYRPPGVAISSLPPLFSKPLSVIKKNTFLSDS
jgi:hypothetical protein